MLVVQLEDYWRQCADVDRGCCFILFSALLKLASKERHHEHIRETGKRRLGAWQGAPACEVDRAFFGLCIVLSRHESHNEYSGVEMQCDVMYCQTLSRNTLLVIMGAILSWVHWLNYSVCIGVDKLWRQRSLMSGEMWIFCVCCEKELTKTQPNQGWYLRVTHHIPELLWLASRLSRIFLSEAGEFREKCARDGFVTIRWSRGRVCSILERQNVLGKCHSNPDCVLNLLTHFYRFISADYLSLCSPVLTKLTN